MTNLYLIAHSVRGEPTFDIATCADDMGTEDDPGPWWIIPTSGHRAYPYWQAQLENIDDTYDLRLDRLEGEILEGPPPMPKDWPDHYATSSTSSISKSSPTLARDLLKSLGLVKSIPIKRRF